ncbi:malate dehydrogenase (quinone) [Rhodococcus phenolicus]|uniref:malate dehydrogenase (quinone) n=1 Tax=Rhodococcus phenolicus TaxID=263849 RepID=UPI000836C862|nr:malate dehydrogenase (quinone) [Rhodococcus phenolicus]
MNDFETDSGTEVLDREYDAVLIGAGIMSATLGALLARLQPDWSIVVLERLDRVAQESSAAWNNAGTGHAGMCELNYMPDPADPCRAEQIGRQFELTRRFWDSLVDSGDLAGTSFVNPTPHMNVVFGDRDVAYLRQRFETLRRSPRFAEMEYSEDPRVIATWAPLLMAGRTGDETVAATRQPGGTDVDFGGVTRALLSGVRARGARVVTGHEVRRLRREPDGRWIVGGRAGGERFSMRTRFVFVGAGGHALTLLQKARIPEVRGYGVFPIGAQFLRTDDPDIVAAHRAKVYSQADVGAPPMSVPHLDTRIVDGKASLMFGPYATFSTRLLKHGRLTDLFATIRPHNIAPLVAVAVQNLPLLGYLIGQLAASRGRKLQQLRRFVPTARDGDWELVDAGQRAQLIVPHPRKIGVLTFGTEVVVGADGTIAGLLGASPGASIAPAVMIDLLGACFPQHRARWAPILDRFCVDS